MEIVSRTGIPPVSYFQGAFLFIRLNLLIYCLCSSTETLTGCFPTLVFPRITAATCDIFSAKARFFPPPQISAMRVKRIWLTVKSAHTV